MKCKKCKCEIKGLEDIRFSQQKIFKIEQNGVGELELYPEEPWSEDIYDMGEFFCSHCGTAIKEFTSIDDVEEYFKKGK